MPKRSLSGLLTILREHGVAKFKDKNIEIEFGPRAILRVPMIDQSIDDLTKPEKQKTPEETDEDILFYSSKG